MKHLFEIMKEMLRDLQAKRVILLFVASLSIAFALHAYNMFHYPYFESDEGTYLSQAYSVKENNELSLYVYWYDHPPFGWITIATWVDILNDDWNFFGSSLNTGRVLMLILHLTQVSLVFFITYRVTSMPWLAFLATLIFSVSPLATYYQRRVLLDNLLTTWVLLSVALLHLKEVKLRHVLMSAILFGLGVVTKITTVMFGPAILYLLLTAQWNIHKGFRTFGWLLSAAGIVSIWILYAAIKTELFPSPTGDRVSLIGSIQYQASRGTEHHFWEHGSSFLDNLTSWLALDATLVYLIGVGLIVALLLTIFSARYRFFGIATICYFFFLIRGGVVIGFYLLPLLPFIAMSLVCGLALVYDFFKKRFRVSAYIAPVLFIVLLLIGYTHYAPKVKKYLVVEETNNQMEGIRWIKENIPEDATILVDINAMTELRDPTYVNEKNFVNADWYFKVAKDPAIRFTKYRDDWRNFDYVLISHEMLYQSSINNLPMVVNIIRNSQPVMKWDKNTTSFIDVQDFKSTNGDWVALYRVNNNTKTQLLYAWNHYRDTFVQSYGQIIDPATGITTSEGQAYGMLRAALMNDEDAFKGIWLWTQHQLQHRLDDNLLSWQWKDGVQLDSANASDADLDIALALLFASKVFENEEYYADAQKIIKDIWRQSVVSINGTYYLLPAEKTVSARGSGYLLNPSYFSPAHYRIFAEVDTERKDEWQKLADDTYKTLARLRTFTPDSVGLPPNWAIVHAKTGALESASPYITQGGADQFSYDAFRTFWRVALDVAWYDAEAGTEYLRTVGTFFEREWKKYRSFTDAYYLNGSRVRTNPSASVSAGILSAVSISADSQTSSDVYTTLFADTIVLSEEEEYAYWKGATNYYDANWTWFGLALFNDNFPNIWRER